MGTEVEEIHDLCDWIKGIYKKIMLIPGDQQKEESMNFISLMLSDFEDELEHYRDQI